MFASVILAKIQPIHNKREKHRGNEKAFVRRRLRFPLELGIYFIRKMRLAIHSLSCIGRSFFLFFVCLHPTNLFRIECYSRAL